MLGGAPCREVLRGETHTRPRTRKTRSAQTADTLFAPRVFGEAPATEGTRGAPPTHVQTRTARLARTGRDASSARTALSCTEGGWTCSSPVASRKAVE